MNRRDDQEVEHILLRYRPIGPSADLRRRVLSGWRASGPTARVRAAWVFRLGMAAMLLVALGLYAAAERGADEIAGKIGLGPPVWDEQAEQTAKLIDAGQAGRQYIALGLLAGAANSSAAGNRTLSGEMQ